MSAPGGGLPSATPPNGGKGPSTAVFAALGVVLLVLILGVVAVFVFTGGDADPTAQRSSSAPPPTTTTTTRPAQDGQNGPQLPQIPSLPGDVPDLGVGDCVELSGSEQDASVVPADCSADNATHEVVRAVPNRGGCPSDVNVRFLQEVFDFEAFTLCLDVNWIRGACYDVTDGLDRARRAECAAQPGRMIERVERIRRDAADVAGCTQGGFPYRERRFVVCTITVERER